MRLAFPFLLVLLCWAPLPVASNRPQPLAVLVLGAGVLLALTAWEWRTRWRGVRDRLAPASWPLGLLAAYAALVHLQALPLPLALVEWISPRRAAVHLDAALGLGEAAGAWLTLSVSPADTLVAAQRSLVYLAVFACAIVLVHSRENARLLGGALVFSGCLQALLGVSLYASGMELRLFDFVYRFADVQGTFANRNHLAAYLVMCLALGLGLMLARFEEAGISVARNWRARLAGMLHFVLGPGMRLRLLLVLMVVALVLTRSRMGNASFFIALLLVGLVALWAWRRMAPVTLALIASLLVIDVILIGHWVGLGRVVQRMEQTALLKEDRRGEETFEERQIASTLGLQTVREYPWVGSGARSFEAAFPQHREHGIQGRYQHAHNDYLEIASDTGLIGLALLAGVVLTSAARALRVLRSHRSRLARGIAFASLMSIVAMAVHSSVEFNLQIPAVALTFCVMLALPWAADRLPSRKAPSLARSRSAAAQVAPSGATAWKQPNH